MKNNKKDDSIIIRTYDLPDIHFTRITGLDDSNNEITGLRNINEDEVDSIALRRWFEQAKLKIEKFSHRDCWLQIDGKIFLLWDTTITNKQYVEESSGSMEQWNFSFREIRPYHHNVSINNL